MAVPTDRRKAMIAFLLFLVVMGAGIGTWNSQQISSCQEEFGEDPEVVAECKSSLRDIVRLVSISLIGISIVGLGVVLLKESIN
ncbi:hypothetical protein HUG10_15850 [Halorarum halophilum]|uniref:Uncharacterized protein n=1 Tax=Halorarum halophilum TaxID=2743090 RepID=A0A7D5GMZ1_9EURY|nr:hypothetical protein [Halobaculum halophilum]QLG28924.1 hypothetical protein HUG10_15850 [Halobaculum halophilum]